MASFVTDGGLETDLIFHHGVDLPHFAAFPLVDTESGRDLLTRYFDGYAEVAARGGAGLMLEAPTWRANPDWGDRLGYPAAELTRVNTDAIALLSALRDRYAARIPEVRVGGMVGPRFDTYRPEAAMTPEQAAAYHRPQLEAFAAAGVDVASAYTLTDAAEAIGIVSAARAVGLPVAISFTVETDGRLPDGSTLADAVTAVDAAGGPDYFQVNCAHPSHIEAGLGPGGSWLDRITGLRANASRKSHAELEEAEDLDEGDPAELAAAQDRIAPRLANLSIVGGCCGTDVRHVAALWGVPTP